MDDLSWNDFNQHFKWRELMREFERALQQAEAYPKAHQDIPEAVALAMETMVLAWQRLRELAASRLDETAPEAVTHTILNLTRKVTRTLEHFESISA